MQTHSFYNNITPHLKFNHTLGEYMNAGDTVKAIIATVNTYSLTPYIKKVTEILSQGSPDDVEFCKRLFEICCKNVEYLRDPEGHEIVFTPKLLMQVGKGDCKKFTTFIWSVMKAKGIFGGAKVVSYDGNNWAHIYMIEPLSKQTYITLDPVNHCRYNKEVNYKKAQVFYLDGTKSQIMNKLSIMGSLGNLDSDSILQGMGEASDTLLADMNESFGGRRRRGGSCHNSKALAGLGNDYMNGANDENNIDGESYLSGVDELEGLGKKGKLKSVVQKTKTKVKAKAAARKTPEAKAKRKEKRKKVFNVVKKAGFAPTRAAFLALVALGGALYKSPLKINLAAKMASYWQKNNGGELVKIWETFGGKREALAKAIGRASKTSLSGNEIEVNPDGSFLSGLGVVTAAAAAATIAAATPITIAMLKILNKGGTVSDQEAANLEEVSEVVEDVALQKSGGDARRVVANAATTRLLREGRDIDGGGNSATQQDIIEEAANEPEPAQGDYENFKPAVAKSGNAAARTASNDTGESANINEGTDTRADQPQAEAPQPTEVENPNPRNLPATKEQFAPRAKSILGNYKSPITWVKAMFLLICFSSIYQFSPLFSSIAGVLILLIFIISVINLSIQKIKQYGKV